MARDTDAALVRRVMDVMQVTERGMASLLDVTQPTVNGVLNGTQFLRTPSRKFVQGILVEQSAARRIRAAGVEGISRGCRAAARDPDAFVDHARMCAACISRSFMALEGT